MKAEAQSRRISSKLTFDQLAAMIRRSSKNEIAIPEMSQEQKIKEILGKREYDLGRHANKE